MMESNKSHCNLKADLLHDRFFFLAPPHSIACVYLHL